MISINGYVNDDEWVKYKIIWNSTVNGPIYGQFLILK